MKIQLINAYELKCTLGTIKDIENYFKKTFNEVVSMLDKMSTSEQIEMLYLGAKRANENIERDTFIEECENTLGVGTLTEMIEEFILQLQYPGQTKEEIQKKIMEKLEKVQKIKDLTGVQS